MMTKIKKLAKSKWFWITTIIVAIVLVVAGSFIFSSGEEFEYTTEPVKIGSLIQTVTATGVVESAQDVDLNFQITGKLSEMNVVEGQEVKVGEVLAQLEAGSLNAQINQYQASVALAQADLDKIRAGSSVEAVRIAQEKVTKAEADLAAANSTNYSQFSTLRDKTLDELTNSTSIASLFLDKVNYYFVDRDNATLWNQLEVDDDDEDELDQLRLDYDRYRKELKALKLVTVTSNDSIELIIARVETIRNFLIKLNDLAYRSSRVANLILVNDYYPQATKDLIKSEFVTQQSVVNTTIGSLQSAKSNLVNSISSSSGDVQSAINALAIARAELSQVQAGPRDFETAAAQANLASAQAQLQRILADASQYALVAPIDGTITKVNYSVGEQTSMTDAIVSMLSTGLFQVKVDIPESDIAKIKTGDKVSIELDAFGSDHTFSGAITFIDPAQTVIQDVTYYKTIVSFDQDEWNAQIKSGMTADVTITTAATGDVLSVPQRAVHIRQATLDQPIERYVEVMINGVVEERKVTIGLRADGGLVEIISGLTEGEQVVTFKKELAKP